MITKLELKNFRNHRNLLLQEFCNGINVISGKNGEGKTNIIEAIYMLTSGRSFRTIHDAPLIMENMDYAYANLEFQTTINHKIEILIGRGEKKGIKIDNKNVKQMSELYSFIPTVIFSPEDIKIIKEGPSIRRRYIDMDICRLKPVYIDTLKKHKNICAEKNKLLKTKNAEKMIEIYNDQLIETSSVIYMLREKYLEKLTETANILLKDMGKKIILSAKQATDVIGDNIKEKIKVRLEKIKKRELEEKTSLFGPQRTDIIFYMNNHDTRIFASQGESGTIAISLKFAAAKIIEELQGKSPVILLDDVFSYLDKQRSKWVLKQSEQRQSFITIAADLPNGLPGNKIFFIKEGRIFS